MRVLVGLGNPGERYRKSRHSIGFYILDKLALEFGNPVWKQFKGGELAEVFTTSGKALFFKPIQFMNVSGLPIRQLMDYYEIESKDLGIIADDVYLAPGTVKIRTGGSDGGHNGWKSVQQHVGAQEYKRIRVGVGIYEQHPDKRTLSPPLEEYVLQPLPEAELQRIDTLIDILGPKLIHWLEQGELEEHSFSSKN